MLERMIETFGAILEARRAQEAGQPNPTLRALLAVAEHLETIDPELQMAIVAAAAENPELLDPLRRLIARQHERILAETADPDLALILLCAFDGLKLQSMMHFPPTDRETRAAILLRLRALAESLEGRS